MWVVLVSNCGLVRMFVLRFVIPEACTYGELLCNEVGAWVFIDCHPLCGGLGIARWLTPTNPSPTGMRVVLCFDDL